MLRSDLPCHTDSKAARWLSPRSRIYCGTMSTDLLAACLVAALAGACGGHKTVQRVEQPSLETVAPQSTAGGSLGTSAVPGFLRAATTPGGQVADPTLLDALYTYAWFVTFGLGSVAVKDESNRFGLPSFKLLGASWATTPLPASVWRRANAWRYG